MMRCVAFVATMVPAAVAINSRILAAEESFSAAAQSLELSVQARQYALLHLYKGASDNFPSTMPRRAPPSNLLAGLSAMRLGEAASLTEEGYSAVAGLRSKEAMDAFAYRLLSHEGLRVKDRAMMQRILPFYNGECAQQSLGALRKELEEATVPHACHAAWVEAVNSSAARNISTVAKKKPRAAVHPQHGDSAPLNQTGYLAVVALKSDSEMKKFIQRISKSEGLQVMNEGGLSGFARYYSGVCASQSFAALVNELRSVQPMVRATSISYNMMSDAPVDEEEVKQRIAAATGLSTDQIEVEVGRDSVPDAAQLKKSLAAKVGVEEGSVTMMKAKRDSHHIAADSSTHSATTKKEAHHAAPTGGAHIVVTVTSAVGTSVEDVLKKLPSNAAMAWKVNGPPKTMVASVAQPQSCGGGWVAPTPLH